MKKKVKKAKPVSKPAWAVKLEQRVKALEEKLAPASTPAPVPEEVQPT